MNFIKKAAQFFKDTYYELPKVTWLGKKEVVATTVVVIIFVIFMSIIISIIDLFLNTVVGFIL